MKMKNIFGGDDGYEYNVHLVPHDYAMIMPQIDDVQNNDHMSFFNHAFDAIHGLLHGQQLPRFGSNGLFDSLSNLWQRDANYHDDDGDMGAFYDDDYEPMGEEDAFFLSTMNMIEDEEIDDDKFGLSRLMDMASRLWAGNAMNGIEGIKDVHYSFLNNAMNAVQGLLGGLNANEDSDQMSAKIGDDADIKYYDTAYDGDDLYQNYVYDAVADDYDNLLTIPEYEVIEPEADKLEVEEVDDRELVLDTDDNFELNTASSVRKEETSDLIVIEITVIIVIIMVCGLFYAGWRYLIDRRQKQREMGYYNANLSNELLIKSP